MTRTRLRLGRAALVAVPTALALGLAAAGLLGPPHLERAIRARLEREAARRGLLVGVQEVHVGIFPPLRLAGVRVEKPGAWSVAADRVDANLRLWGTGLIGRMRLAPGRVSLNAPGGWAVEAMPTRWDVVAVPPNGLRAELREPARGLTVTWLPAADGGRVEVLATGVPVGRLLAVRRDGAPILDARAVGGTLGLAGAPGSLSTFHLDMTGHGVRVAGLSNDVAVSESEPPVFGEPTDVTLHLSGSWHPAERALKLPRWRLTIEGAALSGSLALARLGGDQRLDLSLDVERVDFGRLLRTSGVDQPEAVALPVAGAIQGDLGSASLFARASGRVGDPASFTVSQRLDFTPPRRGLPALERLRGDFVHEVELAGGARRSIAVSSASPDFIAIGDVPSLFVRTLLLGEDAGFWGHRGIDLSEVPSAILINWARGGVARGASTITQQLAKNLFLSRERRLGRKLQELSLALLLEATLSKERILEIYVNVIEWGPGLHGLRPAARRYFHREPGELTPKQIAFLVALIPGPVKYQRSFADGTLSPGFRPLVDSLLAKLRSVDALNEEEYQAALAEELLVLAEPESPAR